MAYVSTHHHPVSAPSLLGSRLASVRAAFSTWRRKREVYLRTLRELQSYRPHELQDLRIQSGDIEELARQQAGL